MVPLKSQPPNILSGYAPAVPGEDEKTSSSLELAILT